MPIANSAAATITPAIIGHRNARFKLSMRWTPYTAVFNLAGQPAMNVPLHWTPEGLPVGVQIVGRNKEDFRVLQMAHAFEQATGFGKKRPASA